MTGNDRYNFFCLSRNKSVSCQHQDIGDVKSYCKTSTHIRNLTSGKSKPVFHLQHLIPHWKKNSNADVMLTNFLVQHNLPRQIIFDNCLSKNSR